MTNYAVATGYDVALISLTDMTPQPRSTGIQQTRRTYAADSSVYEEKPYIELEWNVLESVEQYNALLVQFGLDDSLTEAVTVLIPTQFFAFTRYNGLAVRPESGRDMRRDNYLIRDVTILIKDLALAA